MLSPITIRYPFRPVCRSLITGQVADLFGLADTEPPHVVAENVTLDIRPKDLVLFVGPSGSGKSSLLRAAGLQLGAVDAATLVFPDRPLVEALPGTLPERMAILAGCGLSEARLLLRTPSELSDGQRYRFRMAYAFALQSQPILLDEFAAILDRNLAKVLAFNLRKLVIRSGIGALVATTHEDLIDDLNPDVIVRCHGEGAIDVERHILKKNGSLSMTSFGSRTAPVPTGRTSRGGITAATISPSFAK